MTTVERALELAQAGNCRSIKDIRSALKAEGYDDIHAILGGRSFQDQLKVRLAKHKAAKAG